MEKIAERCCLRALHLCMLTFCKAGSMHHFSIMPPFGSNVIHHAECFDSANLYAAYTDDQIAQVGKASIAVLKRSKTELSDSVKHMLDDIIALCVIVRRPIRLLVDCRIAEFERFFGSGMAGPAEHRLFYLCLQGETQHRTDDDGDSFIFMEAFADAAPVAGDGTNFHQMLEEFENTCFSWLERMRILAHERRWIMTPEIIMMGLQCRSSTMHESMLLLDKKRPISQQLDMSRACAAIADVAVYCLHLQQFTRDDHRGWTDNGDMMTRLIKDRPKPVLDTRPGGS